MRESQLASEEAQTVSLTDALTTQARIDTLEHDLAAARAHTASLAERLGIFENFDATDSSARANLPVRVVIVFIGGGGHVRFFCLILCASICVVTKKYKVIAFFFHLQNQWFCFALLCLFVCLFVCLFFSVSGP